jgi:hypothetical protein
LWGHSLKEGREALERGSVPLSYPLPYAGRGTITGGRG